jgi:hypothetical protein
MEGELVVEFIHGLLGNTDKEKLDSTLCKTSVLIEWKLFLSR